MIEFKELVVSNFLSFGKKETVFELDREQLMLIRGKNEDTGTKGYSANGSGKTASLQALLFALYGKGIDKLKADEFVNIKNGKKMEVRLKFKKNDTEYEIIRTRKPSSLELLIDGKSETLDSMKNTEEAIQRIIGVPYEVFMTVFFMSPHRESFMAMSGSDQRTMMESILSLDVLMERANSVKEIKKDIEVDLKLLQRDLDSASETNKKVQDSVDRLSDKALTFETERTEAVTAFEDALSSLSQVDMNAVEKGVQEVLGALANNQKMKDDAGAFEKVLTKKERLKNEKESQLRTFKSLLETIERNKQKSHSYGEEDRALIEKMKATSDSFDLERNKEALGKMGVIEQLTNDHSLVVHALNELLREIEKGEADVSTLSKKKDALEAGVCHECGQSHTDDQKIADLIAEIGRIDTLMDGWVTSVSKYEQEMDEKENAIKDIRDEYGIESQISKAKERLNKERFDYENTLDRIKSIEKRLQSNPYEEELAVIFKTHGSEADIQVQQDGYLKEMDALVKELGKVKNDIELCHTGTMPIDGLDCYELLETVGVFDMAQLEQFKREINDLETDIQKEREKVNPFVDELEHAKGLFVDVQEIESMISELRKKVEHCGYLVRMLTDNKSFIRKKIVDQYIPFVNKKVMEYGQKLGLLHVASINSDLTTEVEYMQKPCSYFNLSQGERLRLNLSVNLAFRDLITMLGKNSNILMIDEFFDSACDQSFIYPAYSLIKEKAKNVMLISHRDDFVDMVDRVMTVTKRGGFSTVEYSTK